MLLEFIDENVSSYILDLYDDIECKIYGKNISDDTIKGTLTTLNRTHVFVPEVNASRKHYLPSILLGKEKDKDDSSMQTMLHITGKRVAQFDLVSTRVDLEKVKFISLFKNNIVISYVIYENMILCLEQNFISIVVFDEEKELKTVISKLSHECLLNTILKTLGDSQYEIIKQEYKRVARMGKLKFDE